MTDSMEDAFSDDLDETKVRNELLFANREIVRDSDFRTRLTEINKILEHLPASPPPLGQIVLAKTEEEMHQAIIKEAREPDIFNDTIETWATKTMSPDVRFASTLLMIIAGFPFFLLGVAGAISGYLEAALMLLPGGALVASGTAMNPDGSFPDITFRNKVLRRKAYKREVRRLLGEAEHLRKQNASLKALRHRALEAARVELEPLDADFRLKNPGDALDIWEGDEVKVRIVRDSSYTSDEYIAARAIGGSGNLKAISG